MKKLARKIYYNLKPFIPKRTLLYLRRKYVARIQKACAKTWPIDESAGKPPEGWKGWPGKKKFALILTHDVDSERGVDRCVELMKMEKSLGFRSSFNFLAEEYKIIPKLRQHIANHGFEIGIHGLKHDGKLYKSRKTFKDQAVRINQYLKEWKALGFRSPSMHRNLEWILDLDIEYDSSTFDTDPFEPQPDGVRTIFPFMVKGKYNRKGYVELPYTLPQDFTLFILMDQKDISVWKKKLAWVAKCGGMALLNTHPDYMSFHACKVAFNEYPIQHYKGFLQYVKEKYKDVYWHALPWEIAQYWKEHYMNKRIC